MREILSVLRTDLIDKRIHNLLNKLYRFRNMNRLEIYMHAIFGFD
jgi:hypothetical protein